MNNEGLHTYVFAVYESLSLEYGVGTECSEQTRPIFCGGSCWRLDSKGLRCVVVMSLSLQTLDVRTMTYFSLSITTDCLPAQHLITPILDLLLITKHLNGLKERVGIQEEPTDLQHRYHISVQGLEVSVLLEDSIAVCKSLTNLSGGLVLAKV